MSTYGVTRLVTAETIQQRGGDVPFTRFDGGQADDIVQIAGVTIGSER